jgi:hypothetical protein
MGKRSEVSDTDIKTAMKATGGNYTQAAKYINDNFSPSSRVTRQNMQNWVEAMEDAEIINLADLSRLQQKVRRLTVTNNALRREARNRDDVQNGKEDFLEQLKLTVKEMPKLNPPTIIPKPAGNGKELTIELLFSDLQIGKLMDDYDSKIAIDRVEEYIDVVMDRIYQYQLLGYSIEKIVFAILGDIIESDKKHGTQSARACDIGTADQIKLAQELLFHRIIRRLATVGVPIDVIMITGNHDWDGSGLFMFKPGREQLSWPMFHAVKEMSQLAGIDATFYIPEGAFYVHEIYGAKVLYEHGVGVAAGYTQMKNHVAKRSDQLRTFITFFRMGDKHNICRFNNDRLVVNGAFFGDSRNGEEYSGIAGYDGEPAQLMFAHVKRKDNFRTTIFDSLAIQLGHIK